MSGFLTLCDPTTTAAEHRALVRRLLNGGYTGAELEARLDRRTAPANPYGRDELLSERTRTELAA